MFLSFVLIVPSLPVWTTRMASRHARTRARSTTTSTASWTFCKTTTESSRTRCPRVWASATSGHLGRTVSSGTSPLQVKVAISDTLLASLAERTSTPSPSTKPNPRKPSDPDVGPTSRYTTSPLSCPFPAPTPGEEDAGFHDCNPCYLQTISMFHSPPIRFPIPGP